MADGRRPQQALRSRHTNRRSTDPVSTGPCDCRKTDRYVSFSGIDCAGNARRIIETIDGHLAVPGRRDRFWEYFDRKRAGGSGPRPDDLFLVHSHLNQIREYFEAWDDAAALQLLDQVEQECC
nr:N(2)-fixation sustaining protein CowN [Rubrivivax gelatinosus]